MTTLHSTQEFINQPGYTPKGWSIFVTEAFQEFDALDKEASRAALLADVVALANNTLLRKAIRPLSAAHSKAGVTALSKGNLPISKDASRFVELSTFDWLSPNVTDRTELWILQQWLFLNVATSLPEGPESISVIKIVAGLTREWSEVNLTNEALIQNRFLSWHDHTTALRCVQIIEFAAALPSFGLDVDEELPFLTKFVFIHLKVLMNENFYIRNTNHGFDQSYALYLLAYVFHSMEGAELARKIGCQRLINEIHSSFSLDGAHVENSPGYHVSMLYRLVETQNLLKVCEDQESSVFDEIVEKALEFLVYALRPDLTLPMFGDTESYPIKINVNAIDPKYTEQLRYVISMGKEGRQPTALSRFFPKSGYAFIRSSWPAKQWSDVVHLSAKCGFSSNYHRHDDDNAIVLYGFGEDWLIESGIVRYHEKEASRLYARSSWSHNIISIHGVNASRKQLSPDDINSARLMKWSGAGPVAQFEMCSHMYPGFRYKRDVRFDKPNHIIDLHDTITTKQAGFFHYEFRLHIPADKNVSIRPDGSIFVESLKSNRILVISANDDAFEATQILSGVQEPQMAGWHSPSIGRVEKAITIIFTARTAGGLSAHVRLKFIENGQGQINSEKIDEVSSIPATQLMPTIAPQNSADSLIMRKFLQDHNFEKQINGKLVKLRVTALGGVDKLPSKSHYLEHVYDRSRRIATKTIIASHSNSIYHSDNLGETWECFDLSPILKGNNIARCFTLNNGNKLIVPYAAKIIILVDSNYNFLNEAPIGDFLWHGSLGIDQSANGTIIFGEYTGSAKFIRLWRSIDNGLSWSPTLELQSTDSDHPSLRHFHTCQCDPFQSGRWLVSSGDQPSHCRIWESIDDGRTWDDIPDPDIRSNYGDRAPRANRSAYRFTSMAFTPDRIFWPTDDRLGLGNAVWVGADRCKPNKIDLLAPLSINEMRALVQVSDTQYLAISEAKIDAERIEVFLTTRFGEAIHLADVPNAFNGKTAATRSVASKAAHDGVFFSFGDDGCIHPGSRLTRWHIEFADMTAPLITSCSSNLTRNTQSELGRNQSTIQGCNICNSATRDAVLAGQPVAKVESNSQHYIYRDGIKIELSCPICNGRVRTRLMDLVLAKSFKGRPRAQRALLVAAGKAERNAIMTYCNAFDHISLQGNHGDPNCRVGVDITNMFEIESDAYDLVIASDVLDYIPDLGASFREIKRVLKPNGKLFAYIQPWRILPGDMPPTIVHYNALAHEQYAATDGAQTGVPDCRFGIDWLASTARRAGLQFEQVQELDPIGELSFSWFVCEAV